MPAAGYLIKAYLSPSRWRLFRRHLIDLLVIAVPLFRPLRPLRLLTFMRAGLILLSGLRRTRQLLTHQGLHFVLLAVMAITGVCSAAEVAVERNAPGASIHDFPGARWRAIVTVTTVGYGDRYLVRAGGRGVAVVLMITGIGLAGVLSASVASYFAGQRAETDMTGLHARLDRIETMLARVLESGPREPPQEPRQDR